jgi:hypothetical protein
MSKFQMDINVTKAATCTCGESKSRPGEDLSQEYFLEAQIMFWQLRDMPKSNCSADWALGEAIVYLFLFTYNLQP